jgi:hypothetical protein
VSQVELRPRYATFCDYAEHISDLSIACCCNALARGRPLIWKDAVEPAFAFGIHASFEHDTSNLWPPTTAASTIYQNGTDYVHLDGVDKTTTRCWSAFVPQPLPLVHHALTEEGIFRCMSLRPCMCRSRHCSLNILFALDSCCEAAVLNWHNATAYTDIMFERAPD